MAGRDWEFGKGGSRSLDYISSRTLKFSDADLDFDLPDIGWGEEDLVVGVFDLIPSRFFQVLRTGQRVDEGVRIQE